MNKNNITRRDFLRLSGISFGVFLAACTRLVKPSPKLSLGPTPINTNTPASTSPPTETLPPTSTPSSTPTEIPCFRLQSPENGATVPAIGRITFSWEAMPGTKHYRLEFTLPNGADVPFETPNIDLNRYIETFPLSGTYSWQVTAFDNNGEVLCITSSFSFIKPENGPNSQNGSGDGGGEDGSPGPTIGPVVGQTVGD